MYSHAIAACWCDVLFSLVDKCVWLQQYDSIHMPLKMLCIQ